LIAPTGTTLLLGGARSGKSVLALELAASSGAPVTFIATADTRGDADLEARVARHRDERPSAWTTVEAPRDVPDAIRAADASHVVVLDCVTIWVSNLMVAGLHEDGADAVADSLLAALRERSTPSIVVTNEVGMGVHPTTELGREYRDVLGRVNRRLSEGATRALLVVAGRVLPLLTTEEGLH
jgi:adenosylcobinamide kinase / adenosylcobinamide-phosphate guanylyltransferase